MSNSRNSTAGDIVEDSLVAKKRDPLVEKMVTERKDLKLRNHDLIVSDPITTVSQLFIY
jgi:hypothetical protein